MPIRFSLIVSFTLILLSNTLAQTVFVYDKNSGLPIENVYIYSNDKTKTAVSDQFGMADISRFEQNDIIHFQHTSYYEFQSKKKKIEVGNYRVALIENFVNLDEFVISASKWEENTNEIPNKIEVIKKKDIVFKNPQTSADLLSQSGEVFIQKSQLGGGSPMLRGFAANSILFVVDGVRMNNAIYRSGNLQNVLQADVNSVENTEVIFGPGTNIYGSDALGGVIDFHLQRPEFSTSKKWKTTGNAMARFATANFERTLHADINSANNKWAFVASFSFSNFDDLKMGSNGNDYLQRNEYVKRIDNKDSVFVNDDSDVQKFTGYNQMNFLTKLSNNFSNYISWTYGLYLSKTSDVPRYDRLIQEKDGSPKYAEWYYSPQQWVMNTLEIDFHKKTKIYEHAEFILAYQNVKEGRNDRKLNSDELRKRTESVNIFSLNADFDKSIKKNSSLFYGLELVYNNVDSKGVSENIINGSTQTVATRYPDGGTDYYHTGIYATYKNNLQSIPATIQGGLRYSFVGLKSTFNDTSFYKLPYDEISLNNGALTASAGLVYRPGNWLMGLNLSSGFRAPNLDDVAKIFDSEPGNVVVPNEDLKPEYLYNAEINIKREFNQKLSLKLNGFYSYLDNAMVRRDFTLNGADSILYDGEMSNVQAVVNAAYANIYGGSFQLYYSFSRYFGLKTSLSYIKGYDDNKDALRHAPPLFGSTSIVFEKDGLKIEADAIYNAAVKYEDLAPTERSKDYMYAIDENGNPWSPSWWTINLKSSYAFSDKFIANIGVENLLDYRYRPYSSGIAAAGRNFIISMRYTF